MVKVIANLVARNRDTRIIAREDANQLVEQASNALASQAGITGICHIVA